jgi:hypothetical protein
MRADSVSSARQWFSIGEVPGCTVPVVSVLTYPQPMRVGSGLAGSIRAPKDPTK